MNHRVEFLGWLMLCFAVSRSMAQAPGLDTTRTPFQRGGIYDRPYILNLGGKTAVGGYSEMNTNQPRIDGIAEGFSFEFRRFNVFLYSAVSEHVKLTAELEFEHGTEDIKLETALVDVLLALSVNLRAGILLTPIGRFNIAHDAPRYNVVDRPLVSTQIIPATWSEVGAGFFGAFYLSAFDRLTYEIYAVNGLQDGVVLGSGEGTRIPEGKSQEIFAEDNNGSPALAGRLAYNPRFGGEFGVSFYTGRYNTYAAEGAMIDEPRRARILAFDAEYRWRRWQFRGEAALARIDTPNDQVDDDFLAKRQHGLYAEGNWTFWRRSVFGMPEAIAALFGRYDYIDLNAGTFDKTGQNIAEVTHRATLGLAFRPTAETVIRLNYWRQWDYDKFNNLRHSMNVQFGVATYF
ncbi:MAG: TonB-dependent receptor [candidate division KSB1 bacterium]|nr:TonB-dependent receptor [candidate division KSB1 bacterium]